MVPGGLTAGYSGETESWWEVLEWRYGEGREMSPVKEEAKRLIDALPDHATWDDIMYEFYVKKKLAKALEEAAAGEVVSHQAAKEHLSSK